MGTYALGDMVPARTSTSYVANCATVIGNVVLAADSSVWPAAVLRGDNERIHVGERTNVQDGAVLHTDPGFPLHVGDDVSIGHGAVLHGCSIGAGSLVGIRAIVLNGARIGEECLVGAGALITSGKTFPPRSLIVGVPAKAIRSLTDGEVAGLRANAKEYVERAARYARDLRSCSRRSLDE